MIFSMDNWILANEADTPHNRFIIRGDYGAQNASMDMAAEWLA